MRTLAALGPLGPCSTSYSTFALRDRSLEAIEELVGSRSRLAPLEIDDAHGRLL
jgi:hypothetical protein